MNSGRSLRAPLVVHAAFCCLGMLAADALEASGAGTAVRLLLMLAMACVALVATGRHHRSGPIACMLATGFLLSIATTRPVQSGSDAFPSSTRARIEGAVARVVSATAFRQTVIIDGIVDRQDLTPVRARVLVRMRRTAARSVQEGEDVVVIGSVRPVHTHAALLDERAMARSLHIQWIATASAQDVAVIRDAHWSNRVVSAVREVVQDRITTSIDTDEHRAILRALVLGDVTQVPFDVRAAYAMTGTIHMLCVSGAHVALISTMLLVLTTWVRPPWLRGAICSVFIGVFVLVTGAEPPAVRAGLTGILMIMGLGLRRRVLSVNLFGAAVLLMVLLTPDVIHSYSFLLSTIATAALLFIAPVIRETFERVALHRSIVRSRLQDALALNLSVSVITAIPVLLWFGTVAPWSPLANLIIVPCLSAAMITGIIAMVLSAIAPSLGWMAGGCCEALIAVAHVLVEQFAAWSPLAPDPQRAWPAVLTITAGLVWQCTATTLRHLVVRSTLAIMVVVAICVVPVTTTRPGVQVISREWCTAVAIPAHRGTFVLVQDRRPHQQPWPDRALAQWIARQRPPVVVGRTGPASIAVADDVALLCRPRVLALTQHDLLRIHRIASLPKFASQL